MQGEHNRGCALYIHKSLNSNSVNIVTDYTDCIWAEVKLLNNDNLIIGCVYRSPKANQVSNDHFRSMIDKYFQNKNYSHMLLTGDFNYHKIDWSSW